MVGDRDTNSGHQELCVGHSTLTSTPLGTVSLDTLNPCASLADTEGNLKGTESGQLELFIVSEDISPFIQGHFISLCINQV